MYEKFKVLVADDAIFYSLLFILVAAASFGLGRWSMMEIGADQQPAAVRISAPPPAAPAPLYYVASQNGSKYHLPWCPGAQQMNEENKLIFDTKEMAEAQGYAPAANCPGL